MMPNSSPHRPVFYDESRKRWSWVLRLGAAGVVAVGAAIVCLFVSILAIPLVPHSVLPRARELLDTGNAEPNLNDHVKARRQFAQKRDKRKLAREIEKERRLTTASLRRFYGPSYVERQQMISTPVVAGFYVNWEETSRGSLRRHISELTHVFPEWLHLSHDGASFSDSRTNEDKADIDPFIRAHGLPIVPLINNYVPDSAGSENGKWSAEAVHGLIAAPAVRTAFIHNLKQYVIDHRWQGINIDFENLPDEEADNLAAFMRQLYTSFRAAGLLVTQDVEVENDAFDLPRLALWNDYLIPMLYDQHSPGDENGAGPIAGISWTRERLNEILDSVPPSKIVMGVGAYAYDWKVGDKGAASLTYQGAVIQAKESVDPRDPELARIEIDPKSLNPHYTYDDDSGAKHVVWMLDAATAFNQWSIARSRSLRGVAVWSLGTEDPDVWSVIGRTHIEADTGKDVDAGLLNKIGYGKQSQVDFEGEGELLEVLAEPSDGERTLQRDLKTGLIVQETYKSYPSAFVVRRYGYEPKRVVLTFDDGPDPTWTPRILDILKREGVTGAFFVVGKQAEENPGVLARMWREGNEIGNHTFSHPNLALTGHERTLLEITTTQRIIQAVTGHSTTLFRPPYAIDVEPRTGGELKPVIQASQLHFVSVGEKNDPQDWNLVKMGPDGQPIPRTSDDIVNSVWTNRDEGSIILLHDGGGDRSATVEALPQIIEKLKAAGYQFITLAQLRGVSRSVMFPTLTGREEALVGVDKWVFEITYFFQRLMTTLFALSVILGVSRQLFVATLALIQRRRERAAVGGVTAGPTPYALHPTPLPLGPNAERPAPLVTVIIAAYNEEKVIDRTVSTILESDYPHLEVIVVDDGSTDGTFAAASTTFAGESRVQCIRKENGGKASALNRGISHAAGEVIVALDADTLFAPDAISRLVRHFDDPAVGAVSGNVRVGNPRNVLTKWQALEYITSQNFDRRAYDLLNCITVVPGAIGAWRLEAVQDAGGYTSDTLAEDTDLTWKIRRTGWRIVNDSTAHAYTEAPESLRNLSRQRFRWAFGTLQNLVKHRDAIFHHGAFGWVALPSLWLYQMLFPAISPVMDLTVVVALCLGGGAQVLFYYGLMVAFDFLGAALAIRLDGASWKLLPWLFVQRFIYRQLMYYVILKSVVAAVRGGAVGWNKFERRGTARVDVGHAVVGDASSRESRV